MVRGTPANVPTERDIPIRNLVDPKSSISQKMKLSRKPQRNPATKKAKRKDRTSTVHITWN